jgi:hypothetical protein
MWDSLPKHKIHFSYHENQTHAGMSESALIVPRLKLGFSLIGLFVSISQLEF